MVDATVRQGRTDMQMQFSAGELVCVSVSSSCHFFLFLCSLSLSLFNCLNSRIDLIQLTARRQFYTHTYTFSCRFLLFHFYFVFLACFKLIWSFGALLFAEMRPFTINYHLPLLPFPLIVEFWLPIRRMPNATEWAASSFCHLSKERNLSANEIVYFCSN